MKIWRVFLLVLSVFMLTSCSTIAMLHDDDICPGCKPWGKWAREMVCEPNGGPCHSPWVRVVNVSEDELLALYFSPDVYSRAHGYYGATESNRWGTLFTPDGSGVFFTTFWSRCESKVGHAFSVLTED